MRNHKIGCKDCRRNVCCCPRRRPAPAPGSSCICPPGPQGPRGFPGSTIILPGGPNTEKWSVILGLAAAVTLPAAIGGVPGTAVEACTYMADSLAAGVRLSLPGGPAVNIAPNYPATPDGINFDALAATLQSAAGVTLPLGVQIAVQLVVNANRPTERVCMQVIFPSVPGGIVVPGLLLGGGQLQDEVEGPDCFVAVGETYDVRLCLQNTTILPIALNLGVEAAILASATARSSA